MSCAHHYRSLFCQFCNMQCRHERLYSAHCSSHRHIDRQRHAPSDQSFGRHLHGRTCRSVFVPSINVAHLNSQLQQPADIQSQKSNSRAARVHKFARCRAPARPTRVRHTNTVPPQFLLRLSGKARDELLRLVSQH